MVESRRGRSVDVQDQEDSPMRERWSGERNDSEERGSDDARELVKHRSKDKSKSSSRRDDKEYRSRDQERLKERGKENRDSTKDRSSGRDRRKEERDEREKDRVRDTVRDKDPVHEKHKEGDRDKERKDKTKEQDRVLEREKDLEKEGERGRDKDRGDKNRDKDRDREKEKDRSKDKEREKHKDREREKERDNGRNRGKDTLEREKGKERNREKEKHTDQEKGRARDRDRTSRKQKDESHDEIKDIGNDDHSRSQSEFEREYQSGKEVKDNADSENDPKLPKNQGNAQNVVTGSHQPASELEERITRMREERLKKSAGATEVSSWVSKSRKLEEKRNSAKKKALQLSRVFEEQDNMNDGDSDDDAAVKHTTEDLGGVKILHGLDKVLEGGAVILTLKDQSILADGDINEEIDMLENVEIGEQKRRDEAYKAAKKKNVYDDIDKFNHEPGFEKKMLPQYDDPVADEGVTLDSSGRFTGEAERKLEELRKRIQGISSSSRAEDLNTTVKISTDYLTQDEMVKFKKPKKKKSLRKKEKLDIDALEAEAVSAGLGSGDLGSRNNGRRQNIIDEQDRIDAEMRKNAYQSAYTKADEASKALRPELTRLTRVEEDDTPVFGDDDDELRKSLQRARKIALKKQDEEKLSLQAFTLLSTSATDDSTADNSNNGPGEQHENKVVFTEMEEFVLGLQHDEETQKPDREDVFMEEDEAPITADHEMQDVDNGWTEVKETMIDEASDKEDAKEDVVPDETIHESAVGKGLAATLRLLKDRGALKETIEWGGRNMDKKKSKLVGIHDEDGKKEIRIERTDEYGRILTPKEAFRLLSHKFHGKEPGKMKKEKRMRQYQEEMKVKQMKNADTPSHSVQRMREAQATLQTPYLVLSGNIKAGQSSDHRSGFATVEKDLVGSLTPMLGDAKVEHFLNIKRKPDSEASASQKKPKA